MDLSQYLDIFIDETKEHLQTLNDQVLILEAEPENVDSQLFGGVPPSSGEPGVLPSRQM